MVAIKKPNQLLDSSCHTGIIYVTVEYFPIFLSRLSVHTIMIKRTLAALSIGLVLANFAPAFADDAPAADAPAAATSSKTAEPDTPSAFKNKLDGTFEFFGKLPRRLVFFTTGTLVGTPYYFVRKTKEETASGVTDLVGERKNPIFLLPAATLAVAESESARPERGWPEA